MASQSRRTHGFTLIEVLVVVAIIALMVAILIPSLARARNEAQTAVCASNMKQALNGVFLHQADVNMRKEEWSTNFGWAIYSLKQNKGQFDLFTCPADPSPRPAPAVQDRLHYSENEPPFGTTTGDAVFTRLFRSGSHWTADLEDQVNLHQTGGDSYDDIDGDALLQYQATPGQHFVTAQISEVPSSGYRHDIMTYKGGMIQDNLKGTITAQIPLIWMSYGANASAGLKEVKGTPLLIVEAAKMGVFAEKLGNYPSDHLGWVLRFRHGDKVPNKPGLRGVDWTKSRFQHRPARTGTNPGTPPPPEKVYWDQNYEPRTRLNAGFIDGHVERMGYWELMDLDAQTTAGRPMPRFNVWFGARKRDSVDYGP